MTKDFRKWWLTQAGTNTCFWTFKLKAFYTLLTCYLISVIGYRITVFCCDNGWWEDLCCSFLNPLTTKYANRHVYDTCSWLCFMKGHIPTTKLWTIYLLYLVFHILQSTFPHIMYCIHYIVTLYNANCSVENFCTNLNDFVWIIPSITSYQHKPIR